MRLGLTLPIVAVEIEDEVEKEREIDEEGETDAAEGVTDNLIRLYGLTSTLVDYRRHGTRTT
jgi:hypothetical protein